MDSQNQNEMIFRKLTHNVNFNSKPYYSQTEENEIFFASDNKLIKYNYKTSFFTNKSKISPSKKIKKFLIKDDNIAYCLLKANSNDTTSQFIEYNLDSKEVTSSFTFQGEENEKIQNFTYSTQSDTFILITNTGDILYIKRKEGNFILSKHKIIFTKQEKEKITKQSYKKQILFTEINNEGKIAMFSFDNKLILHNLINSESFTVEFVKSLSCGMFISEDKAVVGDSAGKLHFISNLFNKDNKISIATKHWHAHRVNTIETDYNGDYLYSAGKEGVIVIWNLKTEEKSFLPRLNAEINNLRISPNSQYLSAVCADNSIKTIDLFNFNVVNEYSGLSLSSQANEGNIRQFSIKQENFLLFFNESNGKVQVYNLNSGRILSSNYVFNKNFVSNTENEEINCKKLKNVEIELDNFEHLVTYEQIIDEKDPNFLISYLKIWKLSSANFKKDFSLELICAAENPHGNERISKIEFKSGKCVTFSQSHFKVWEKSDTTSNFVCSQVGAYKQEITKSLTGTLNNKDNSIYAIHNSKYLIKWDLNRGEIEKIFVFDFDSISDISSWKLIIDNNTNRIYIYSKNKILSFSLLDWEIKWEENFENFVIRNLIQNKERFYLTLSKTHCEDEYLIYSIHSGSETKLNVDDCFYLRKKNLIYMSVLKNLNSLVLVNSNIDVIVTKKNSLLGNKKQKREVESEDEDMTVDLFQNKNK